MKHYVTADIDRDRKPAGLSQASQGNRGCEG